MSPSKSQKKNHSSGIEATELNHLEKKYGKEPKISNEEFKEIQWNWH